MLGNTAKRRAIHRPCESLEGESMKVSLEVALNALLTESICSPGASRTVADGLEAVLAPGQSFEALHESLGTVS